MSGLLMRLDGERTRWGMKGSGAVCVQNGAWTVLKSSNEISANVLGEVEYWDGPNVPVRAGG